MKRFFVSIVLAASLLGCAARVKTVTNLPPGVTQQQVINWDSAVSHLHRIADVTSTLRKTVISLNRSGVLPDGVAYANILEGIARVDQIQITAADFLKTVPNSWAKSTQNEIATYMQTIAMALSDLTKNGVVGIKNPSSQQQVLGLINEISAAVSLILTLTSS